MLLVIDMKPPSPGWRSDVVVVGGGLVGCATAYYLARRGCSVQIVERGRVGGEQSSRAWGLLRRQGRHSAEIPLAIEALRIWATLPQELGADMELVRDGIVVLAETAEDEARLVDGARASRSLGVESRLLTPRQIGELLPQLGGAWRAGQYTPGDGHVEPIKATRAFAAAARRLGVQVHENAPALAVETTAGVASGVATAKGSIGGDAVVCAAGIGSADLSRTVGVSLPIQVVRASVAQTFPARYDIKIAVWAPHAAFRPKADGSFYVGNGYRGIDAEHDLTPDSLRHITKFIPTYLANRRIVRLRMGSPFVEGLRRIMSNTRFAPLPEPMVNEALIEQNRREFGLLLPSLQNVAVARAWAGRIDATPDLIPMLGAASSLDRYFVAAGFNGHGLALAPVVGRTLAELIVDSRCAIDLHRLRIGRYAENDFQRSPGAL